MNWTVAHKGGVYVVSDSLESECTKVGLYTASKHKDPLYQRRRALQQGNPKPLIFHYTYDVEVDEGTLASTVTKEIEAIAHSLLKKRGYKSLYSETRLTGHGEWFKCSPEVAITAVKDAAEEFYDQPIRDDGLFFDPASYIIAKRMAGVSDRKIENDLFEWGCDGLFCR